MLQTIGPSAFMNNQLLKSVDLSNTIIEHIEHDVFAECYGLETVILPRTCETIAPGNFNNCEQLHTVTSLRTQKVNVYYSEYDFNTPFLNCNKLTNISPNIQCARPCDALNNYVLRYFYFCEIRYQNQTLFTRFYNKPIIGLIKSTPKRNMVVYRGQVKSKEINPCSWFSCTTDENTVTNFMVGCCYFKIHLVNVPAFDVNSSGLIKNYTYADEKEIIVLGGGTFYKDAACTQKGTYFIQHPKASHYVDDDDDDDDDHETFTWNLFDLPGEQDRGAYETWYRIDSDSNNTTTTCPTIEQ